MKGFSRRLLRLAAVVSIGAAWASGRVHGGGKPPGLTDGWDKVPLKYQIQKPYNLELKDRYKYDAASDMHLFWVHFSDKPHKPPPNRTTPRTEMRIESHEAKEHMFEADVNISPGTFACIAQLFEEEANDPVIMIIAHPNGRITVGNDLVIRTDTIGKWWNLKITNDPAAGGRVRIYVDDELAVATFSRGPKSYYFKCGVYSRKGSARSEARFRNVKMWVKNSDSPAK